MNDGIIEKAQKLDASGKPEEAVQLLIPLVNDGDVIAKSNLGFIYCYSFYENGNFVKIKEGEVLLNEACEAGEPSACHNHNQGVRVVDLLLGKEYNLILNKTD